MVELNYRPLSGLALGAKPAAKISSANVHVWELPKRRMITLRIDPSDADLVAKAASPRLGRHSERMAVAP